MKVGRFKGLQNGIARLYSDLQAEAAEFNGQST